ncbi:DinB family protein [candidate division KSB1 bacterium]
MDITTALNIIKKERKLLDNVLNDFKPEHGEFKPTEEMMSAAHQIKHIALTTGWFMKGAFGSGFEMNFEEYLEEMKKPVTLEEALGILNNTYDETAANIEKMTEDEISSPLPENPILGQAPRFSVLYANSDHTAHHRGVLTVYLRLLGITPKMIYSP